MTTKVTLKKVTDRLFNRVDATTIALAAIPIMVAMTACTGQLSVGQAGEEKLASAEVTKGLEKPIYPDAVPSVADGSVYWKQNNCASCHGEAGKGGSASVDLTNAEWMRARKPNDQYMVIAFGKGKEYKTPTLTETAHGAAHEPTEPSRTFEHEAYASKLSRRQIWDLVFYARSLAVPVLLKADYDKLKVIFGANCAICHGTRGAGDGPLNKGLVLQPAPANFNQFDRFYDRTDEMLWDHIANGIKWEGMPNFLGKKDKDFKFNAENIWMLVQFVRNFHEDPNFALEKPATDDPNAPLPGSGKQTPAGAPAGQSAAPAAPATAPAGDTTTGGGASAGAAPALAPSAGATAPQSPSSASTAANAPAENKPAGSPASTTPAPAGAPASGGQAPPATPAH